jgi:N-acetylneuraminate synthase/sialic acid synthase
MFRVAKECGVNAVKLQKRDNRGLYTRALYNAPYDNENSFGATYGEHREALELDRAAYVELTAYARELGLALLATAWDFKSADLLADIDIPAFKIASGDVTNTPLLAHVARFGKPLIVSTGGATMADIQRVYDTVMPLNSQLCLLHCTASYPADPKDLNLKVISVLRETYANTVIGLSDHENGIDCAIVAYMLGARVFEKHFTLNHAWKGTDHAYSLEPTGMKKMVRDLHRIPVALGDGIKRRLPCEEKPLLKMSKKLVAARDLAAGCVLTRADVALKSPGDGLPPYELDRVIGRRLRSALREDNNITFENLEHA